MSRGDRLLSFAKLVEVPDKYLASVPSDFVRDAQHIMKLIGKNPPGPTIECRPLMDEDGQYLLPSWTIHYMVGTEQCQITFAAPFRWMRDLVENDPALTFVFGPILGGSAPAPSTAQLRSRYGQYEAAAIADRLALEKEDAKDISDLV